MASDRRSRVPWPILITAAVTLLAALIVWISLEAEERQRLEFNGPELPPADAQAGRPSAPAATNVVIEPPATPVTTHVPEPLRPDSREVLPGAEIRVERAPVVSNSIPRPDGANSLNLHEDQR